MQYTLLNAAVVLGALSSAVSAKPTPMHNRRDVLKAIDESADDKDLKFQPLLDFDKDGCYNTAAIHPDGTLNPGKGATHKYEGDCRGPAQLENSNTYTRHRCNHGVCAVMYEYYFEKDQAVHGSFLGGHRHDWENIVVFFKDDQSEILRVSASCHGGYESEDKGDFKIQDDTHPLMVYHKDGPGTHCFRFATGGDQDDVENHFDEFYRSPVISWGEWPSEDLKKSMLEEWDGGVGPKLDTEFGDSLKEAAGDAFDGFDPYNDN